jgi:AAHS family 4-hydroxybenzoate transporter-like MFS transporter
MSRINVTELVDNTRIGALQVGTFTICLLCLILDGFDVQALGYVAPALVRDWNVPNASLGPVFAAANFGVLIGSLSFSVLADRIGRRPVLIGATLFFSAIMIATARVNTIPQLLVFRFIAGIGLGGIMPNAMALVGEYSPKRSRVTLMMNLSVGFTIGAAIGGFIAAWMIPAFGWRSVFYMGGFVPLLIGVAMILWLPESLQFLVLHGRGSEGVKWVRRIDPSLQVAPGDELVVTEQPLEGAPVGHLFREGRGAVTVLFWIVNFMNLLNLYSLASWLPTVVRDAGYTTSTAVLVGTVLQVGGTFGTFGLAWLIARSGFVPMLTASFAIACISIALIGQPGIPLALLFVIVFVAGWAVVGSQPGINAFEGVFYPTYLRSTGIGWGLGVGRAGAIVGPYIGGEFMARAWSTQQIFLAAAVPAAICTLTMIALGMAISRREQQRQPARLANAPSDV